MIRGDQFVKALSPMLLFGLLSIILSQILAHFDCDNLTQEMYEQSQRFKETGDSFETILPECYKLQDDGALGSLLIFIAGVVLTGWLLFYYRHSNKKEEKRTHK